MESFNTSQSAFSSRRSYPALNHVSLAPLTPRFPIDDDDGDDEPTDYFTARRDSSSDHTHGNVYSNAGRTSYLSSVSVPSTPPILSHSRSTSRARQPRSKSQTRLPLSDTNLQSHDLARPLHHHRHNHHPHHHHHHNDQSSSSKHGSQSRPRHARHDSEWLLRAGIALASSTREEKGQSWLVKRESSTSLVNDANLDGTDLSPSSSRHPYHQYHRHTRSAARTPRSGISTPSVAAALSRRNSRSHGGSRRGSRAGLAMTSFDIASAAVVVDSATVSPSISTASAGGRGRERGDQENRDGASTSLVAGPDFVDERIRAEMASIQAQNNNLNLANDVNDTYCPLSDEESLAGEDSLLFYSSDDDEEEEEIDERELQRLTRQRGFGLGGWLDRLVEWTLFGVDDWPVATTTVAMAEEGDVGAGGRRRVAVRIDDRLQHSRDSQGENEDEDEDDADDDRDHSGVVDSTPDTTLRDAVEEAGRAVEKPGEVGGWEDASWLFRVVKQALV